jgi:hypothetical protein
MNIVRESGFYFLNVKSNYFGNEEYYVVSVYFYKGFMIYEIDPSPGKINLNDHLFNAKIKNRDLFTEKIDNGEFVIGWSNNTNLGKWVSPISIGSNRITGNFLGHGFANYYETKVTLSIGGFFNKKIFIEIEYLDGESKLFVPKSEIKFYEI